MKMLMSLLNSKLYKGRKVFFSPIFFIVVKHQIYTLKPFLSVQLTGIKYINIVVQAPSISSDAFHFAKLKVYTH